MKHSTLRMTTLFAIALVLGFPNSYGESDISWMGGTVYDFGKIKEADGAATHRFVFRNTGGEPFVVLGAVGRCGCTTATYSEAEVAPGDTASVVVRFDPAKRSGAFKQRVTVLLSGPSGHNSLFVKGEVEAAKNDSKQYNDSK